MVEMSRICITTSGRKRLWWATGLWMVTIQKLAGQPVPGEWGQEEAQVQNVLRTRWESFKLETVQSDFPQIFRHSGQRYDGRDLSRTLSKWQLCFKICCFTCCNLMGTPKLSNLFSFQSYALFEQNTGFFPSGNNHVSFTDASSRNRNSTLVKRSKYVSVPFSVSELWHCGTERLTQWQTFMENQE